MNKFACRKKIPIDIFLIFCHYILAMILFRILTKSKEVHVLICFSYRTKTVQITLQCILIGKRRGVFPAVFLGLDERATQPENALYMDPVV